MDKNKYNNQIVKDLLRGYSINNNRIPVSEIAGMIGLSLGALYSNNPKVETLYTIAEFFNVDISVFFGGPQKANKQNRNNDFAYKKLVKTQEDLILKQEKMCERLEQENKELREKLDQLMKDKSTVAGYGLAADDPTQLMRKEKVE